MSINYRRQRTFVPIINCLLVTFTTGSYSSIFVAAPILVDLAKDKPLGEADLVKENAKKVKPVTAKV